MECNKETLYQLLIIEEKTYEDIGKLFNITGVGLKKRAKNFGIELPNRRKVNDCETFRKGQSSQIIKKCLECGCEYKKYPSHSGKYCSIKCQKKFVYNEYINKWKNGEVSGLQKDGFTLSNHIRKYLFIKHNSKCENCSWGEVNIYTNKIPLQVHHIDGDCKNTNESNLQLLCPNCHTLTYNFGSRNKNATNGRSIYFGRNKIK